MPTQHTYTFFLLNNTVPDIDKGRGRLRVCVCVCVDKSASGIVCDVV